MMLSTVELITVHSKMPDHADRPADLLVQSHGIPRINGHFLVDNGVVKVVCPKGVTTVLSAPFRGDDGQVYIHFALGDLSKSVAHTITIDGLEMIAKNLETIVAIARLEQGEPDALHRRPE